MTMDYLPKELLSDDIIFHYTSVNTAIQYILHENKLRLSPRKESNDPVEKINFRREMISGGESEKLRKLGWETIETMKKHVSGCKQICFCKNQQNNQKAQWLGSEIDSFGFLKPRMWDQYGDGYGGVCLAFSKSELLYEMSFDADDIRYLSYMQMKKEGTLFNINGLTDDNKEDFFSILEEKVMKNLFWKHKDYSGENEFRICSFAKGEFDWLKINDALKAVIVSPQFMNDYSREYFNGFCKKKNIELIEIIWENRGIKVRSRKNDQHKTEEYNRTK